MKYLFAFSFLLFAGGSAWSMPSRIMIIRHAEKPKNGNTLNARGYQRAQALPQFFESNPEALQFGPPIAIYAMKPGSPSGSVRAIETVTPLAQKLGITLNQNFVRDDLDALVKEISHHPEYKDHLVVICWEHQVIPQLAVDLGLEYGPMDWNKDVFDRVWTLDYNQDEVSNFMNLPENLLPGDSET